MKKLAAILVLIMLSGWASAQFSGGTGTSGDPYQITTPADLHDITMTIYNGSFGKYYDGVYFKMTNDISLSDYPGWYPIGFADYKSFAGIFDGNGKKITELSISDAWTYGGLFGYVSSGCNIKDLTIENCSISINGGDEFTGGLVGYIGHEVPNTSISITNCHVSGNITSTGGANGGLIGGIGFINPAMDADTFDVFVTNCTSSATVSSIVGYSSRPFNTGGLIGIIEGNTLAQNPRITNCSSSGTVSNEAQGGYLGGLIRFSSYATISGCFSNGDITAIGAAGGLTGYSYSSTISDCYSFSNATAMPGWGNTGGFIGYVQEGSVISRCYSSGLITGNGTEAFGFSGYSGSVSVTGCFWDMESSGQATSSGTEVGKTTAEMKTRNTFTNASWDFMDERKNGTNEIWGINPAQNNGYPFLKWQGYTNVAPLSIVSFTPVSGVTGTTVTITGTAFSSTPANNLVYFGAVKAIVSAATSSSLTVSVPVGAVSIVPVSVTVGGRQAFSATSITPAFNVTHTPVLPLNYTVPPLLISCSDAGETRAIAIADFNNDGNPDMAIVNQSTNNVSIIPGNGDGTFSTPVNFPAGSGPTAITTADFNSDGKPDLAVNNSYGYNVGVFLGNGDGTFAEMITYNVDGFPWLGIYVGEFNDDGIPDLVTVNDNAGTIGLLLGNGDGTFGETAYFNSGNEARHAAVGDYNNDGKQDVAVANTGGNDISLLMGSGTGSFAAAVTYAVGVNPFDITTEDFNKDGNLDLAVLNVTSKNISVLLGSDSGNFADAVNYDNTGDAFSLTSGDLDGDGQADLVTNREDAGIINIFRGKGDGTFYSPEYASPFASPMDIAISDFNKDGKADMATANWNQSENVTVILYRDPPAIEVSAPGYETHSYYTLEEGLNAASVGYYTGDVTVKIKASVTVTATALITVKGSISPLYKYNTITIYPTASGITISGNVAGPLIDFGGATDVTLNGSLFGLDGGKDLTIINTNTSSSASTIRFVNDASDNTVKYCTLQGATGASATGVVLFGTSTLTTGNDNNLIDNNTITGSVSGRSNYGVYSSGTVGKENSGNTISNNTIYDYLGGSNSSAICLTGASAWTIRGNSIYETTNFSPPAGNGYYGIKITGGDGYVIEDNFIGGKAADHSGMFTVSASNTHSFWGIYLIALTANASSVQNNTISNFDYTSTNAIPWTGICVVAGKVTIGDQKGNTIGAISGNGSVKVTNSAAEATSIGINILGTGEVTIQNNTIGSITTVNSSTLGHSFYGIYKQSVAGNTTISNNLVGSMDAGTTNSINASSDATTGLQTVLGIFCAGTDTNTISGNTIARINNSGTKSSLTTAGICYQGSATAGTVSENFINSLSIAGTAGSVYGLQIISGAATYSNNIISIGGSSTATIYGINVPGTTGNNSNLYYNTVYIGGSLASGVYKSYALYNNSNSSTRDYRNNTFYNARSTTGGVAKHYAAWFASTGGLLTCDYNDYYISGTGGKLAHYGVDKVGLPIVTGVELNPASAG